MPTFTRKQLQVPHRVCLRLRAAREAAGFTLEALAEKTKINKNYLAALEDCRFHDLPVSSLYQKNFIKKYAEAIGIDPEPFTSQFLIEESDTINTNVPSQSTRRRFILTPWPNVIRLSVIVFLASGLLLYLGKQVKRTIDPPKLSLAMPDSGYIAHDNTVNIAGISEPEVQVRINGQPIKSDERGQFNEAIALSPGLNTIVVVAQKKHGKSTQSIRHIIYEENPRFSLQQPPSGN